jgi:hypothetical protein
MKTIFVIDDNTSEAKYASEFTLAMAQSMEAKIIVAHTIATVTIDEKVKVGGAIEDEEFENHYGSTFLRQLIKQRGVMFDPQIDEIDISLIDESGVAGIINKNQVWMIIKGIPNEIRSPHQAPDLNVQFILNKVLCPLLLIPDKWKIKKIERLVYMADLRYCRIQIVKYLADLAKHWQADLSIVHISAKGLPDIAENYALSIFENEICVNIDYDRVFFNNIKGGNIPRAVDVIIHTMHNDMLALIHHRFHFQELLGAHIGDNLPANIIVPLLVFPY